MDAVTSKSEIHHAAGGVVDACIDHDSAMPKRLSGLFLEAFGHDRQCMENYFVTEHIGVIPDQTAEELGLLELIHATDHLALIQNQDAMLEFGWAGWQLRKPDFETEGKVFF